MFVRFWNSRQFSNKTQALARKVALSRKKSPKAFDFLEDRLPLATLSQSLYPPAAVSSATAGWFGLTTASDEDFQVVGMPRAYVNGFGQPGAAFVFSATTGALVATMANPSPASGDYFGNSVSVSGNTVVVGAPYDNAGVSQSGQAYVFNAKTGALVVTLDNPSPAVDDWFGYSVSVSGNMVVVGAYSDNTGAFDSGQAYVFDATTGSLIATLANPSPANIDHFGASVSVSGNTVVVGTPNDGTGAPTSGQAYLFNSSTGALMTTIANPSPATSDHFGASVSASGNSIVIAGGGQAYVFDGTTFALMSTLDNPSSLASDRFGNSVSVSGNTVVVGAFSAYSNSGSADNSGKAYVFNATTGTLIDTLTNPTPARFDQFGTSVSVWGNIVAVGTPYDDTQNVDQGVVYVYTLANITTPPKVVSVTPNGNIASLAGDQRSRVASLVVAFDQPVQLDANALTLALHTNNVTFNGVVQPNGFGALPIALNFLTTDKITWIVTFTVNTDDGSDGFKSLRDGVYDLNIAAARVHPFGVSGISMAANSSITFHRMFGDTGAPNTPAGGTPGTDFAAVVNTGDNLSFRGAFNNPAAYKSFLDFNGDGVINSGDNLQFRNRFNKALTWRV